MTSALTLLGCLHSEAEPLVKVVVNRGHFNMPLLMLSHHNVKTLFFLY